MRRKLEKIFPDAIITLAYITISIPLPNMLRNKLIFEFLSSVCSLTTMSSVSSSPPPMAEVLWRIWTERSATEGRTIVGTVIEGTTIEGIETEGMSIEGTLTVGTTIEGTTIEVTTESSIFYLVKFSY